MVIATERAAPTPGITKIHGLRGGIAANQDMAVIAVKPIAITHQLILAIENLPSTWSGVL
jgi:hypothetical protein